MNFVTFETTDTDLSTGILHYVLNCFVNFFTVLKKWYVYLYRNVHRIVRLLLILKTIGKMISGRLAFLPIVAACITAYTYMYLLYVSKTYIHVYNLKSH